MYGYRNVVEDDDLEKRRSKKMGIEGDDKDLEGWINKVWYLERVIQEIEETNVGHWETIMEVIRASKQIFSTQVKEKKNIIEMES